MKNQNTSPSQRGFTALELIIVLIVGFSIIALSSSKIGETMNVSKAVRALDSIITLSNAIKELENLPTLDYAGIINGLKSSQTMPRLLKLNTGGTAFLTEWNQDISIGKGGSPITYPGVPQKACVKLVPSLVDQFKVGIVDANKKEHTLDMTSTQGGITTACGSPGPLTMKLTVQ